MDSEGGEGGSRRRGGPAGGLDKERMWLTNSQPRDFWAKVGKVSLIANILLPNDQGLCKACTVVPCGI